MEVVVPLRVHAQAALRARGDDPRVVQVGLGDQEERPVQIGREAVHGGRQLLQEVARARVGQGVHRVQAQPVDPVVPQPRQRAVHQIRPHLVGAGRIQVHGDAPGRVVGVGEVRAEGGQVVAGRAQVVVHHVQDHAEAERVRPVDEPFQRLGPAVRLVHRPQRDPLVPPAMPSGEGAQRHQLDVGDAQAHQVFEALGGGVEGALGGVRPHVQLVQDPAGQRTPRPRGTPGVPPVVDDRAQPVGAVRLAARSRVRQHRPVVHREAVSRPVTRLRLTAPPPRPLRIALQRARGAVALHTSPRPACGAHTSNCTTVPLRCSTVM
ncbi:hypothetical protein STENM327S_05756 [Streptomyces tendae]